MAIVTGRPVASSIPVEAPPPPAKLSTIISSSMDICALFISISVPPSHQCECVWLFGAGMVTPMSSANEPDNAERQCWFVQVSQNSKLNKRRKAALSK